MDCVSLHFIENRQSIAYNSDAGNSNFLGEKSKNFSSHKNVKFLDYLLNIIYKKSRSMIYKHKQISSLIVYCEKVFSEICM
jgi:hypothetical protein